MPCFSLSTDSTLLLRAHNMELPVWPPQELFFTGVGYLHELPFPLLIKTFELFSGVFFLIMNKDILTYHTAFSKNKGKIASFTKKI